MFNDEIIISKPFGEDLVGYIDVTLSDRINNELYFDIDNFEGNIEWLVYYTRFLCEDNEVNGEYLEKLQELDEALREEEEHEED